MKPVIRVQQTLDRSAVIRQAMKQLCDQEVLVGIPGEKAAREGEMDNATIGYIQEHGSPEANIPGRPFLLPGIKKALPQTIPLLRHAAKEALRGNIAGVTTAFNKAGMIAVNFVRGMFVDNDWTPLKNATLADRARAEGWKGPRRKKGETPTPKRSNPLLFTGQLRKAISYVVRRKGS